MANNYCKTLLKTTHDKKYLEKRKNNTFMYYLHVYFAVMVS